MCTYAQKNYGETLITRTGDALIMSAEQTRRVKIGGNIKEVTVKKPVPLVLNGVDIYHPPPSKDTTDDSTMFSMINSVPVRTNGYVDSNYLKVSISAYTAVYAMVDSCIDEFDNMLKSGHYSITLNNVVVNEKGHIVYYETDGLKGHPGQNYMHLVKRDGFTEIPEPLTEQFALRLKIMLHDVQLGIFMHNNLPTPYYCSRLPYSQSRGNREKPPFMDTTKQSEINN